jgi:glutathione S-transferase
VGENAAMKLYAFPRSPNCSKVLICASELGLPLEVENLALQDIKTPRYLAIHPLGAVPALTDGELTLWESGAILSYLADKDGRGTLLSREPRERADTLRWLFFYTANLHPYIYLLGWEKAIKQMMTGVAGADPHRVAFGEEQLTRSLPVLDAHLARHDYLGPRYGIADIAAGVSCTALGRFVGFDLGPYPAVTRWLERLGAREAWQTVLRQ